MSEHPLEPPELEPDPDIPPRPEEALADALHEEQGGRAEQGLPPGAPPGSSGRGTPVP